MNRRTLFARLSALALAPLAKLIPEREPLYVIGCDVASDLAVGCGITVSQEKITCDPEGVTVVCESGCYVWRPKEGRWEA
jgi:hypothetical protein